jgi:ribosomal protein S18 acetylase RimI-like enzyme
VKEASTVGAAADLRIRRAHPADAGRLAPLFEAYRGFYGRDTEVAAAGAFIRDRLQQKESVIFLAESGDRLVGFVQLYPSFDSVEIGSIWILHDLFVTPEARRKGAALGLMAAARRLAESTGACGISLATAMDNTGAQALYEGLGYIRDHRFYHYFLTLQGREPGEGP